MSARRFKSRRRLRSEILPLASVCCLVCALAELFPRSPDLLGLAPRRAARAASSDPAACAFVSLTEKQEAALLAATRASWQAENVSAHRRIELLPAELPEIPFAPAAGLQPAVPPSGPSRLAPRAEMMPPTEAAPAPVRLPKDAARKPALPFPRELLLELN